MTEEKLPPGDRDPMQQSRQKEPSGETLASPGGGRGQDDVPRTHRQVRGFEEVHLVGRALRRGRLGTQQLPEGAGQRKGLATHSKQAPSRAKRDGRGQQCPRDGDQLDLPLLRGGDGRSWTARALRKAPEQVQGTAPPPSMVAPDTRKRQAVAPGKADKDTAHRLHGRSWAM